jgi:hypothetical protein
MKKTFFKSIVIAALSAMSVDAYATTVAFGVVPTSRTVANDVGTALTTSGGSFWIGTFSNEAGIAPVVNNSLSLTDNVSAIIAAGGWERFGFDTATNVANAGTSSTTAFDITTSPAGKLGGDFTDNSTGATKADFFNGKKIYVWVFNADTIGGASQMGIFTATAGTNLSEWTFKTNAGGLGDGSTLSTTTSNITLAEVGGVGSISGSQLRTEAFSAIPEPSRAMLAAMGLFAGLIRRRRK